MTTKTIELVSPDTSFKFKDPKVSDLYDKSQKMLYYVRDSSDGKKYPKKKYPESKKEFSDLVGSLVKQRFTLKNIRNILQDTKYDGDNDCHLSQILVNPFNFLNEEKQLITFTQVMNVVDIKIKQIGTVEEFFNKFPYAKIKLCMLGYTIVFLKKLGNITYPSTELTESSTISIGENTAFQCPKFKIYL